VYGPTSVGAFHASPPLVAGLASTIVVDHLAATAAHADEGMQN